MWIRRSIPRAQGGDHPRRFAHNSQRKRWIIRLVQVSKNPFVTTLEACLRCAQHNIDPNF